MTGVITSLEEKPLDYWKGLSFQYLPPCSNLLDSPKRILEIIRVISLRLKEWVCCLLQEGRWRWYTDEKIASKILVEGGDFSVLPLELISYISCFLDDRGLANFRLALTKRGAVLGEVLEKRQTSAVTQLAMDNMKKIEKNIEKLSENCGGLLETCFGVVWTYDYEMRLLFNAKGVLQIVKTEEINNYNLFLVTITLPISNREEYCDRHASVVNAKNLEKTTSILRAVVNKMVEYFDVLLKDFSQKMKKGDKKPHSKDEFLRELFQELSCFTL